MYIAKGLSIQIRSYSYLSGHLDRVVHGNTGDEILAACDEVTTASSSVGANVGNNPALHFFRGLRHRNLAAIKLATQSGISHLQGPKHTDLAIQDKSRAFPLVVNGFRMNPKEPEGHILFFDVEALGEVFLNVHVYISTGV